MPLWQSMQVAPALMASGIISRDAARNEQRTPGHRRRAPEKCPDTLQSGLRARPVRFSHLEPPKPNYALDKTRGYKCLTCISPEVQLAKHYLRTKIWTVQNCSCVSTASCLAAAFASASISEGRTVLVVGYLHRSSGRSV